MPISPGMLFLQIVCVKGISGLDRIDIIFYRQKIHENQAIKNWKFAKPCCERKM